MNNKNKEKSIFNFDSYKVDKNNTYYNKYYYSKFQNLFMHLGDLQHFCVKIISLSS